MSRVVEFSQMLGSWELITSKGATGCLTICRRDQEARLYFRRGVLIYVQLCGEGMSVGSRALEEVARWREGELAWRNDLRAKTQNITMEHVGRFRRSLQRAAALGIIIDPHASIEKSGL